MSRNEYPNEIPEEFYEKLDAVEERARLYTDADFEKVKENMKQSAENSEEIEDLDERISEVENDLRLIKNHLSAIETLLKDEGDQGDISGLP